MNEMNFDPQTGQPIENTGNQNAPVQGNPYFENGFSNEPESPKKKPIFIFAIIFILLAIIGVGVGVFFYLSNFGNTNKKILQAFCNTFQKTDFMKTIDASEFVQDGEYSFSANLTVEDMEDYEEYEGISGRLSFGSAIKDGEYGLTVGFDYPDADLSMDGTLYLDKEEVVVSIPALANYTFFYAYKEDNDGYLLSEVDEYTLEEINNALSQITDINEIPDSSEFQKELKTAWSDAFMNWEFEKIEASEFTVNGKDQKCKGYSILLTSDMMIELIEETKDIYIAYCEEMESEYISTEDISDAFNEIIEEAEYMDNFEVAVYLYKNQIAAITLTEEEDEESFLDFYIEGGSYPLQNWTLWSDEDYISKTTTEEGNKEISSIEISNDEEIQIAWSYNKKSGEFTGDFSDGYNELSIVGTVEQTKSAITLDISKFEIDNYGDIYNFTGSFAIHDENIIEKPTQNRFDIGNADEEEVTDMQYAVQDTVYELMEAFQ